MASTPGLTAILAADVAGYSRLMEADEKGVSGRVHDQIRDRLPYPFDDLGEQSVKNIARPVRVYALRPDSVADLPALIAPFAASASPTVIAPRLSIVVLPFTDLSNDPEQQYFADGITEYLTTDLPRIEGRTGSRQATH